MQIELPKLTCKRCGHIWIPKKEHIKICPKCKSIKWNIPKKDKTNVKHDP